MATPNFDPRVAARSRRGAAGSQDGSLMIPLAEASRAIGPQWTRRCREDERDRVHSGRPARALRIHRVNAPPRSGRVRRWRRRRPGQPRRRERAGTTSATGQQRVSQVASLRRRAWRAAAPAHRPASRVARGRTQDRQERSACRASVRPGRGGVAASARPRLGCRSCPNGPPRLCCDRYTFDHGACPSRRPPRECAPCAASLVSPRSPC